MTTSPGPRQAALPRPALPAVPGIATPSRRAPIQQVRPGAPFQDSPERCARGSIQWWAQTGEASFWDWDRVSLASSERCYRRRGSRVVTALPRKNVAMKIELIVALRRKRTVCRLPRPSARD